MDKRNFIKTLGALSVSSLVSASELTKIKSVSHSLPKTRSDEELWATIRSHYTLKDDYINLESGYYSIIPNPVLEHFIKHVRHVNIEGSYYMRNDLKKNKDRVISELANLVGSTSDQIAITRNTTESLDLVISGFQWKNGDEAIYAKQDYGSMKEMFEQISSRYGVKNKIVSVPNHPENDEEIVRLYENEITAQTKLIMISHMINITGHILPVKKICNMAHGYGVKVLVDGAHCIGHFDFEIEELNCDYYGSSLHKWLATPLGAGLLYVADNEIPNLWPLMADNEKNINKIKRHSHNGTIPVHTDLAIVNAIEYLQWIGVKRKEKRLRFLKNYWLNALKDVSNIVINTSFDDSRSCGIGNVGVANMKPEILSKRLYDEFKIFTVAIDYANVKGCRITPNVFTTTNELDSFIKAMKSLASS